MSLRADIREFHQRKTKEHLAARQLVALRLTAGIDLDEALGSDDAQKARLIPQLERRLERERLRGMRRHWAYDLNRHISLKQALDLLREPQTPRPVQKHKGDRLSTIAFRKSAMLTGIT